MNKKWIYWKQHSLCDQFNQGQYTLGRNHREFLVIPKVEKKQEICGVFLGFGCNFPNWENATKTNVGFK